MVPMMSMGIGHHLSAHRSRVVSKMFQEEKEVQFIGAQSERRSVAAMISIQSVFSKYIMHRWSHLPRGWETGNVKKLLIVVIWTLVTVWICFSEAPNYYYLILQKPQ